MATHEIEFFKEKVFTFNFNSGPEPYYTEVFPGAAAGFRKLTLYTECHGNIKMSDGAASWDWGTVDLILLGAADNTENSSWHIIGTSAGALNTQGQSMRDIFKLANDEMWPYLKVKLEFNNIGGVQGIMTLSLIGKLETEDD